MLVLFLINFASGILLIKIKEIYILLISVFCIAFSTLSLLFFGPITIEYHFWLFVIYTIAIGLIPVAIVCYIDARTELMDRQKLISSVLIICFVALLLIFQFSVLQNEIQFIINLVLSGIVLFFLIFTQKEKSKTGVNEEPETDLKLKSINFAEFLLLISPIFIFFVTLFVSNIIYVSFTSNIALNSYLFNMRRISEINFLPFLIGSLVAFIISRYGEYLGRKVIISLSFGLIGLNWILSSIIGYTIIISLINGVAYGLMITVGIFTISGDVIFKSNLKLKSILICLFLTPIFLYELLISYFFYDIAISYNWILAGFEKDFNPNAAALLILGFSYDWLFLGLQLNFYRNSLFSLMIGLYILGLILSIYSPETFPIKKKQKYLIEKYISKAKEIAEKQ
ncbi:MAG: hypothetical protein ACFFCM_00545 [Promethearchaeota archaeon]